MEFCHTRALLKAVLTVSLKDVPFVPDPVFGLAVPTRCAGVPDRVLQPRDAWADKAAYDQQAAKLAALFAAEVKRYA